MSDRALFNLQVFACFSFVLVVLARSLSNRALKAQDAQVDTRCFRTGLACVFFFTCLAYVPSLGDPFLSDDYILIQSSSNPAELLRSVTKPSGDGAMRPIGELVFGTLKVWAHRDPAKWHLVGLSLHFVNISLLYWLCKRLSLSSHIAFLACLLFALHPAHPEAVGWVSSAFDLLATGFSISALIAFTYDRVLATWVAAPLLTILAILSKESAYAIPAIAFFVVAGRRTRLWPSALVAAALFVHRWQVFSGPGGYLDPITGRPQIFNITLLSAAKVLLYRPWWTLLVPIDWAVPPNLALKSLLCLMYLGLAVLAFTSKVHLRRHTFLAATLVSVVPPIHLALIGSDLQGTRVFYLPSVLFCIWLAAILSNRYVSALVVIFCFFALRHNLAVRSTVATTARTACETASFAVLNNRAGMTVKGLPRSLDGVFFFANGFQECVSTASGYTVVGLSETPLSSQAPSLVWNTYKRTLEVSSER